MSEVRRDWDQAVTIPNPVQRLEPRAFMSVSFLRSGFRKRAALGLRHPMACRPDHWPGARSRGGRRSEMRRRLAGQLRGHSLLSSLSLTTRECRSPELLT